MRDADPLTRLLAVAAAFDWVTPVSHMVKDAAAGDACRVKIRFDELVETRLLLKQAGIESWGWSTFFDETVFSIHDRDARRVAGLLGLEPPRAKRRVALGFLPWLILIVALALVAFTVISYGGAL